MLNQSTFFNEVSAVKRIFFPKCVSSVLCLKDTTDFVAYVAKDPVNRRGKIFPARLTNLSKLSE